MVDSYIQYLEGCQKALYARINTLETQQSFTIPQSTTTTTTQTENKFGNSSTIETQQNLSQTLNPVYQKQLEQTYQLLETLPIEQRQLIINKQLLESIEKTLQDHGKTYSKEFTFTKEAKIALTENHIKADKFENVLGNAFQLQVAEHSVTHINKAAALRTQCLQKDTYILNACDAAINFADAAFDMVMTSAHPDTALSLNRAAEASYTMGQFLKDAGGFGFLWADNTRRILQGEVVGTVKAVINTVDGVSELLLHPQETIQKLDYSLYQLDRFLSKLIASDPKAVNESKQLCQAFMNLSLEKKSAYATEFLMSFCVPGKIGSMITSLAHHPSVARGITFLGKLAAEELPMLKVALGSQLKFHIESTELVNFGGQIMSSQLKDQIINWGKTNKLLLSDSQLVERAEALLPLTALA